MYLVRIVGPAGSVSYLSRGREVDIEHATRYSSPSAADNAGLIYREKTGGLFYWDVLDTRDERVGA